MQASRYADSPPPPAIQSIEGTNLTPTAQDFVPDTTEPVVSSISNPIPHLDEPGDTMGEFAQTRAPDDLFDDDFTPIPEPVTTRAAPSGPRARSANRQGEPGGRGGGRGRGGRRVEPPNEATTSNAGVDENKEQYTETPKEETKQQAVRGDRSGTGGVKKKKLTEDELTAKLASLKIKNAALEEAHRRAEADEASFQQREQVASAKRREERQNRQLQEGEREKNRQRKLKAVQGREWDAEKKEEDYVSSRGGNASQFRRGAYGGVAYEGGGRGGDRDQENDRFPRGRDDYSQRGPRGRGRGRGGGGGLRGSGRGSFNGPLHGRQGGGLNTVALNQEADSDFPALPGGDGKGRGSEVIAQSKKEDRGSFFDEATTQDSVAPSSAAPASETWADQVEAGTPIKPSGGW
ncbi:MAG: hypothetical protein M1827_007675 [Pycnora praestabilis]|nr:MAG: hypothetical protein M1827_007675 [Pycnora praestabilis]